MKNPFKKHTKEGIAPPWFIIISPVSEDTIQSRHEGLSLEDAMSVLKVVIEDYEKQHVEVKEEGK